MFLQKIIQWLLLFSEEGEKGNLSVRHPSPCSPKDQSFLLTGRLMQHFRACTDFCMPAREGSQCSQKQCRKKLSYFFCRKVVWGPFLMKALGAEFALCYLGCPWKRWMLTSSLAEQQPARPEAWTWAVRRCARVWVWIGGPARWLHAPKPFSR